MTSLTTYSLPHNLQLPRPHIDRTHFGSSSKSGSKGGGKGKNSIALTALTLLAFLFFLNILQNCLDEHMMNAMTPQQVVVMTAQTKSVEAENRKGDTDESNTTVFPESREDKDNVKIPVKLKTPT